MWAYESVFYQIYPLGMCGAPLENDGKVVARIRNVLNWVEHMELLGIQAVYFSPVFESDSHGYNTRDYTKIDCRLGTNADFAEVCDTLHAHGIRVVLDGVFNHVGRGFWAFQDVLKNREQSPYVDWFARIDFSGNSNYGDGLWYEGWEGNYDLVKLNLKNPKVVEHIFEAIDGWINEFNIDGLRLDVAYCLEDQFLRQLREHCEQKKADFFLLGEAIHGDYNRLTGEDKLHSATNYECYKGLYSSFNCMNMFEINHSLIRQFGQNGGGIYRGKHLLSFVDNHDVSRIATILENKEHLPLIYTLAFAMPGIPCVYYGSEWGTLGDKKQGDAALRPEIEAPEWNALTTWISRLAAIKNNSQTLCYGDFKSIILTNEQCLFEREWQGKKTWCAINASDKEYTMKFAAEGTRIRNLMTGNEFEFHGELTVVGYSAAILEMA